MAYETFIPEVESQKLLKERDKWLVLGKHCTNEYTGEIKKAGDRIRITVVGTPTVYQLQKDGTFSTATTFDNVLKASKGQLTGSIPAMEEIENGEIQLQINQVSVWNYGISDIDKDLSSDKSLMAKYREKQAKKLAYIQDKYIAKVLCSYTDCLYDTTAVTIVSGTATTGQTNVLDFIDLIVQKFNENDINDNTQIVCECSPKFYRILKKAYADLDKDNSEKLAGRTVGRYNDIPFFKTNALNSVIADSDEWCIFRTTDSTWFGDPYMHNEAYRKEAGFADGVKGFDLYDAAILEPKAIITAKISY